MIWGSAEARAEGAANQAQDRVRGYGRRGQLEKPVCRLVVVGVHPSGGGGGGGVKRVGLWTLNGLFKG